jgi:hypothetical protein
MHMKTLLRCCLACGLLSGSWSAAALFANQQPSSPAPAQSPAPSPAPQAAAPAARPADVDSMEHIIAAVYDVISGPAGKRDWDRFRSLFYPGARLIPSNRNDKGAVGARVLTPEQYMERGQAFFDKEGFFEKSVANRVENWDHIAHVWSTYESRHSKDDAKPFARGINSFQLLNDGSRWWIVTIYWEAEDAAHQLPEKYLK